MKKEDGIWEGRMHGGRKRREGSIEVWAVWEGYQWGGFEREIDEGVWEERGNWSRESKI
jgi:hypothetical protein